MELSVMSPVLAAMSLEESLAYLKKLGVDSFEIGARGRLSGKSAFGSEAISRQP